MILNYKHIRGTASEIEGKRWHSCMALVPSPDPLRNGLGTGVVQHVCAHAKINYNFSKHLADWHLYKNNLHLENLSLNVLSDTRKSINVTFKYPGLPLVLKKITRVWLLCQPP